MKVLHINTSDTGGAANAAIRLHLALLENGVDSHMLFANRTRDDVPNSHEFKKGKLGIFENIWCRINRKLGRAKTYWEKHKEITAGQSQEVELFSLPYSDYDITEMDIYDKVDVINLHWISGFLDYNFFSKNRKPIVWTLHDMNPFTGGCHYSYGCDRFVDSCNSCPQLIGTNRITISKTFLKYKKKYLSNINVSWVVLCEWMSVNLEKSSMVQGGSISKIYNSVNQQVFKDYGEVEKTRAKYNLPLNKKIFLFVSENVDNKRKGIDIILDCARKLNQDSFVFCAIGKSNEILNEHQNIISLGSINEEEALAKLYGAVDAVIIPSREDNLPNVMVEALSCGTPVIAQSRGGLTEIIDTGVNGLLFDNETEYRLVDACQDFLMNKFSFNNSQIAEMAGEKFSPKLQSRAYLDIYKSLV